MRCIRVSSSVSDSYPSCASGEASTKATARRSHQSRSASHARRSRQATPAPSSEPNNSVAAASITPAQSHGLPCCLASAPASIGAGMPTGNPSTRADAKLARPISERDESHDRPPGQPPTLGG